MKRILAVILCAICCTAAFSQENTAEVNEYTSFLLSNMSLADLEAKPVEYWEANVREALQARKEALWDIPEREFRHFVLPVRVNNEYPDDFRTQYGAELRARIKGLSAAEAALEVNHWCHEMATYKPSDARTSSPLQTIQRGLGRCGEESVLCVAALRAAGIPARQVYTPRWAHTDDNHAWVEVYVDGKWWFLGACEPEPRLNMGWFNGPVSRAMLLHTKVFGNYEGPEDIIDRRGTYTEINVTSGYVPTRRTEVTVVDEDGSRVSGASVEFKIYNYAEFYTVAKYETGLDGTVALHTGKGDLLIWASKGDRYGVAKASGERTTLVLDHRFGRKASFDFEIVPPVEDPIPTGATEEEIAANKLRLAQEDEIRSARPHGNDEVINSFLAAQKGSRNAQALVASLSDKDRGDVTRAVLDDAAAHCGARFKPLRDCPRIEIETLVPYFKEIGEGLKKEGLKFRNKTEIREWVDANIRVDGESNPQMLRIPPVQVWRTRRADPLSRDIFYVALCRVAGFEAEYDAVNGKVQEAESVTPVTFEYDGPDWLQDPLYYRHFTLARIEDGSPRLLSLDDNADIPLSSIRTMKLEDGEYLVTTGVRMADGSVQAHLELFEAASDTGVSVPLKLGSAAGRPAVIGSMDAEQLFLKKGESREQSILSAAGRGYFIIAVLGERDEPSIHAVNELASCAGLLNDWSRPVIVLSKDGSVKGLESIDNVIHGTDPDGKVLKMLADGCNAASMNLPVVAVCDSFGRIVLFRQGYDTSLSAALSSLLPVI